MREYGKIIYQFHKGHTIYWNIQTNAYTIDDRKENFMNVMAACQYIDSNSKVR